MSDRKCSLCGEEKDESLFYNKSNSKTEKRPECKKCSNSCSHKYVENHREQIRTYHRKWSDEHRESVNMRSRMLYKNHPERVKRHKKRWKKNNPIKVLMSGHTRRAKKRKVINDLTEEQWKFVVDSYSGKCVYCGKPADSMDHVVPISKGGGHTQENVVPACLSCNSKKNNKSLLMFLYHRLADSD